MAGLYEDEILGAQQSRELARKLRESGEVTPQGQMVSGWYVPPSIAQSLAGALKQGIGAYKENQAEDEIKDLRNQRLKDIISAKRGLGMPASQRELEAAGTPAQKPSVFSRIGGALGIIDEPKGTPAVPMQQPPIANFETLTPAQQATAMSTAAGIIPTEAGAYMTIKEHQATKEAAKQKQIEDIASRKDLQTERLDVQKQMAADRLQNQRDIQAMIQANRPERQAPQGSIVEIIDPNDPTKLIKMNTLTREVYGTSGSIPKVAAVAPEVSDANAAKDTVNYLRTKYVTKGANGQPVDTVENLIKGSTSGGAQQTAADAYEYLTGKGTSGAENIAQLKTVVNDITLSTLKGKLGAGISNADRDFLQAKLGDIGNPKLASNVRLAAWQEYKNGVAAIANGGRADVPQGQAPEATQPQAPAPAPADTGGFSIRAIP